MSKVIIEMERPDYCSEWCPLSHISVYGEYIDCMAQKADIVHMHDGEDELFKGCPFKTKTKIEL